MLEAEFQANVVQLATTTGWRVHHDRGDYRECIAGDPGFPDLVLARGGRVVFAELKSDKGKPSAAQLEWLFAVSSRPRAELHLWRPSDIDEIGRVLSGANT